MVGWGPNPPPKRATVFSAHVYCGQTVAHLSYCWALVVQLMAKSRYTLQWATPSPSKLPLPMGDLDLHLITETTSRLVEPLLHSSLQTVPIVYNGRPIHPSKLPLPWGIWSSDPPWERAISFHFSSSQKWLLWWHTAGHHTKETGCNLGQAAAGVCKGWPICQFIFWSLLHNINKVDTLPFVISIITCWSCSVFHLNRCKRQLHYLRIGFRL